MQNPEAKRAADDAELARLIMRSMEVTVREEEPADDTMVIVRLLDMTELAMSWPRRVARDLEGYDAWLDRQNGFEKEQRDEDRFGGDNRG